MPNPAADLIIEPETTSMLARAKPRPHHRPGSLPLLDESWRDERPAFVPRDWVPLPGLPATRSDCPPSDQPCPYVTCRQHLWFVSSDERPGGLTSYIRPATPETCALRVVEAHPEGLDPEEIGELLGVCSERVRQLIRSSVAKLEASL